MLNAAETLLFESIISVHVPVPEQAPLQPPKVLLALGVAVSVKFEPAGYVAKHVCTQLARLACTTVVLNKWPIAFMSMENGPVNNEKNETAEPAVGSPISVGQTAPQLIFPSELVIIPCPLTAALTL